PAAGCGCGDGGGGRQARGRAHTHGPADLPGGLSPRPAADRALTDRALASRALAPRGLASRALVSPRWRDGATSDSQALRAGAPGPAFHPPGVAAQATFDASAPIVVDSPCPVCTVVSGGSVSNLARI